MLISLKGITCKKRNQVLRLFPFLIMSVLTFSPFNISIADMIRLKNENLITLNISGSFVKCSPDGSKICYISREDTNDDGKINEEDDITFWIVNSNGTEKRKLLTYPGNSRATWTTGWENNVLYPSFIPQSWSPDGVKILCYRNSGVRYDPGEFVVIDIITGEIEILENDNPYDNLDPCWGEEGHTIIFRTLTKIKEIQKKALSAPIMETIRFFIKEREWIINQPVSDPDNPTKKILYPVKYVEKDLWIKKEEEEELVLPNIEQILETLIWAPDKLKFACTQQIENNKINKLWVITRTGDKILISDMPAYHSDIQWFPDSKRILFTASTKEGSDIFIATIEGESKE